MTLNLHSSDNDSDDGLRHLNVSSDLAALTASFKAALTPVTLLSNGQERTMMKATASNVRAYARAFTEIWVRQSDMMKQEMVHQWFIDCTGLLIDDVGYSSSKFRAWGPVKFDFSIIQVDHLFRGDTFLDTATFESVEFHKIAKFELSRFDKPATFDNVTFRQGANFSKCLFRARSSFQRVMTPGGILDFSHASFARAPVFHETKLPQGTSFDGANFSVSYVCSTQAEVELDARAFRTLKQAASGYRGQQDEADFFALEQKARRVAYLAPRVYWKSDRYSEPKAGLRDLLSTWTWRQFGHWRISCNLTEWLISLVYGCVSNYGRSPARALLFLILTNLATLSIFANAFTFGECKKPAVDYCSVNFYPSTWTSASSSDQLTASAHLVIQNLLNPTGLVTEKAMLSVQNPAILIISITQLTVSYLVLLLLALAIRTRFQKGGGGDK